MSGEELARLCFAAQPLLWAVAIIAVLVVGYFLFNGFFNNDSGKGVEAA
jgi:hypothetical protein